MPCAKDGCRMNPGTNQFCIHHRPDSDFPECPICLKVIRRTKDTLGCTHSFHKRCIDNWAERAQTCPICREPFGQEQSEWAQVLHGALNMELTRAVNDLNMGARTIDIHIGIQIDS